MTNCFKNNPRQNKCMVCRNDSHPIGTPYFLTNYINGLMLKCTHCKNNVAFCEYSIHTHYCTDSPFNDFIYACHCGADKHVVLHALKKRI